MMENGNRTDKTGKVIDIRKPAMSTEEASERMMNGRLYLPTDEEIIRQQCGYAEKLYDYNATRPREHKKRAEMLKEMLAEVGRNCVIEPPFHANWGGRHVHIKDDVYANTNLTLVDDGHIYIGNNVMFGPNVTVVTAGHPVEPNLRRTQMQFNIDVRIGDNVWIGAGAIILPGVVIGDNTVIGAGSVVTKDIPSDMVAVGNPCRILRPIGERDRKYYYKDREIDI